MKNYSSNPRCVTILYGTENGNAEDYARLIAFKLEYLQLKPTLAALDDYPLKQLVTETDFLIIICSTTGQGELPRNSKKFMKFLLKKKLPSDLLNHIYLSTFGLGDSSYTMFNYAIRKLQTRLVQLGCEELSPGCEADEMSPQGIDGFYTEWESQLISSLQKFFPDLVALDEEFLPPPKNEVIALEESPDVDTVKESDIISQSRKVSGDTSLKFGVLKQNLRVTSEDHFQDVRHVIIESEDLRYIPGDTVSLYPSNDNQSVELLIQSQPHWKPFADKPLVIEGELPRIDGGLIDKKYITLRSLLTHHFDIMAIPRRSFFCKLWHFGDSSTEDGQREQEKLREFSNFEESEELYNYANRPRRSILETLLEFQENLRIPINYIFDLFPVIKPRFFSIASRPSPTSVELVVAIVEYKTIIRRIRRGLCSKWLKSLHEGDKLLFSTQKMNMKFSLPQVPNPPIIMVAPGTGIAPMKSLIEYVSESDIKQELYLFYGCRYKEKDYLFSELWDGLTSRGKLHNFPCFSRDADSKIKYVQDNLFHEYKLIGDLILNKNALVFVCGSSGKMPKQVKLTFIEILRKFGDLEEEKAQKYVFDMEDNGRYREDVW
ncbi:NADPH-ferrihemo protein reductase [Scheffersomyces xylosifermentans]|uniref:NADPH-ferrihemo protein reductase n=1 Tax=Scheffersomyces xylosifermentans TaxID=1304137 RepID=UPI00315D081B